MSVNGTHKYSLQERDHALVFVRNNFEWHKPIIILPHTSNCNRGFNQVETGFSLVMWIAAYGDDGRLRGFGHLDFTESASVKKAMAKSGESLMGRELFIDSAANKPKRDSFGGAERTPRQQGMISLPL